MDWRSVTAAALLFTVQLSAREDLGEDRGRLFTVTGQVGKWGNEPDDWFRLSGLDAKLLIPAGDERERYWRLVENAWESGGALRVRVDAAAGRLAASGNHVVYPVCSISDRNVDLSAEEARNCPATTASVNESERLLALGLAMSREQPDAARRLLTLALGARPRLPSLAQAVALKERSSAAEVLADNLDPTDPEHDRLLASALADYRGLAEILPDRPAVRILIAEVLQALGGYDEAHEIFREIERRSPDDAFEVAVGTSALYRQQGDYARSLSQLDEYAAREDSEADGMRYHYHRSWTLMLLGRDEEAERQILHGIVLQPDYPPAYLLRACVRARLGRLDDALADEQLALELLGDPAAGPRPASRDFEQASAAVQALQQAIAAGASGPVTMACDGYWDRWSRPRPRSPLLDGRS
jgi:tetratricopeptide (TPR) repeat protein